MTFIKWQLLLLSWFSVFLLPGMSMADPAKASDSGPVMVNISRSNLPVSAEKLRSMETPVSLQVNFNSLYFDRFNNPISYLFSQLPLKYPELKLNPITRRFHQTVLYLGELNLVEFKAVQHELINIPAQAYREFNLNRKVTVLDPKDINIEVYGLTDSFLGIIPHKEFVDWQYDYWRMLKKYAPKAMILHMQHLAELGVTEIDRDSVHISVLQWGPSISKVLDASEVESLKIEVKEIFAESFKKAKKNGEKIKPLVFDPSRENIQFELPPKSLAVPGMVLSAFKINKQGKAIFNEVSRWEVTIDDIHRAVVFEYETAKSAVVNLFSKEYNTEWTSRRKFFAPEPLDLFVNTIENPMLRMSFERYTQVISSSHLPSKIDTSIRPVYVANEAHPMLQPTNAEWVFSQVSEMNLTSTQSVMQGLAIYASSVRADVQHPGDFDLLLNNLIYVNKDIQTVEEARADAIRQFDEVVLGQIRQLTVNKKIAILEFRLGSDSTMGYAPIKDLSGYEENPYLDEKDLLSGKYTDRHGKLWTLQELLAREDFAKLKVDLFSSSGERFEISLQFNIGFDWKGNVYSLQRHGLKGVSPFLRTAVYESADSFAVASLLKKASEIYRVQKGGFTGTAIKENQKLAFNHIVDPEIKYDVNSRKMLLRAKLMKKIVNILILAKNSGTGLDQLLFEEAHRFYERHHGEFEISIQEIVMAIRNSFNQVELKTLNDLRRKANDFDEFNERQQLVRVDQITSRLREFFIVIPELKSIIDSAPLPENVKHEHSAAVKEFEKFIDYLSDLPDEAMPAELIKVKYKKVLEDFENKILKLEGLFIGGGYTPQSLTREQGRFLQYFVDLSPLVYFKVLRTREVVGDYMLDFELRRMGIQPSSENIARLDMLVESFDTLSYKGAVEGMRVVFQGKQLSEKVKVKGGLPFSIENLVKGAKEFALTLSCRSYFLAH